VTNGDNSNIMIARVAKETYGIERVVARIYDPGRAAIYQRLGIATVATAPWATDQAMRRLVPHQTKAEWVDATGTVAVLERPLPVAWVGRPLADLDQSGRWRIALLNRAGAASVPESGFLGQEGDVVTFAVQRDAIEQLDARLSETNGKGH
jgi:trk system potassium uptake protein TrkA